MIDRVTVEEEKRESVREDEKIKQQERPTYGSGPGRGKRTEIEKKRERERR